MNSSPVASAAGELLRERDRVVNRLAAMPLDSIPYDAVLAAVQQLADLASTARGDVARSVPRLAQHAAADQVSVLVGDAYEAAAGRNALVIEATHIVQNLRRDLS